MTLSDVRSDKKLEDILKGKTMKVYYFMLKQNKPLSAREIQRRTGLSSPSLSLHHLAKLQELDLVTKIDDEGYVVSKYIKIGILRFFVNIGAFLVPRYTLYLVFFGSLMVSSLIIFGLVLTAERILLYLVLCISIIIFVFETYHIWKAGPV